MSRGDFHWFADWDRKAKTGVSFNLSSDVLKMGIITNAITPSVSTADPRWGPGGTTNFSTAQVGVATAYTGPVTLSGVTYTRSGAINKLDFTDFAIALDALGFTDGYWGIVYDDTVSGKHAVGYVDLAGPLSIQTGPANVGVTHATGAGTATAT